jgi:hypothetical protein
MSDRLRREIYGNYSKRETEALLEIWRTNDRYEWSEMTFDVIREILQERGIEPPPQGKPVYHEHKLKSAAVPEAPQERHVAPSTKDEAAFEVYEPRGAVSDRPKTVTYAVYLALGALVIGAALAVVNLATGQLKALAAYPQFAVIIGLIALGFLAFEAWLIHGVWLGRNRRRILYMVWIALSNVYLLPVAVGPGVWLQSQ